MLTNFMIISEPHLKPSFRSSSFSGVSSRTERHNIKSAVSTCAMESCDSQMHPSGREETVYLTHTRHDEARSLLIWEIVVL